MEPGCLAALESGAAVINAGLEADTWLLDRYAALLRRTAWQETMPFDNRMPSANYSAEAHKVYLLKAWVLAGQGDAEGVRRMLQEDGLFWRRQLVESGLVMYKVTASVALRRHFAWSNIILRRLPSGKVMDAVPAHWLQPISDAERSMLRSMAGETRATVQEVRQLKMNDSWDPRDVLARHTTQVQDFANRYSEHVLKVDKLLSVPYEYVTAAVVQATLLGRMEQRLSHAPPVYNAAGDVLFSGALLDIARYAVKITDVEVTRRATLLVAQLRAKRVAPASMAEQLRASRLRHPYSGLPFEWDARNQAVTVQGLQTGAIARQSIFY